MSILYDDPDLYVNQKKVINVYQLCVIIIPFLTIPIYLEALFCLFSPNQKLHQQYIYVLMFHVSLCFIGEFYGFLLMRPIVILPIVGLYTDGALSYLNVHTFTQVILLFGIFQVNAATMIHLLLFRLQTIIPLTYKYYKQLIRLGSLFLIFTYTVSISSLWEFALLYEDQNIAKHFWSTVLHGNVPSNFWSRSYVVVSGEKERFNIFLKLSTGSLILYTSACFIIPSVAFHILNKSKSRLSKNVIEGHKMYLNSLIIQVIIIISFLLIPFAFFILGLKLRLHSPLMVAITITLALSHGAVSTLALIFANRPYRYIMMTHLNTVNSAILTNITLYRLKIIIPPSYRHYECIGKFGIGVTVFIYIGSIVAVFSMLLLIEDQKDAKNYLYQTVRPIPSIFWSDHYIVSTNRNKNLPIFLLCGTIALGVYIFLCIAIPMVCYYILHKSQHILSPKVVEAQRIYLRTILIQVTIVVLCVICPFAVFFWGLVYQFENTMIVPTSIMFALLNGSASTLTLIISNRPYRQIVKYQLQFVYYALSCSKERRNRKVVQTLSSIVP